MVSSPRPAMWTIRVRFATVVFFREGIPPTMVSVVMCVDPLCACSPTISEGVCGPELCLPEGWPTQERYSLPQSQAAKLRPSACGFRRPVRGVYVDTFARRAQVGHTCSWVRAHHGFHPIFLLPLFHLHFSV